MRPFYRREPAATVMTRRALRLLVPFLLAACEPPGPRDMDSPQQATSDAGSDSVSAAARLPSSVDELLEQGLVFAVAGRAEIIEAIGPPDSTVAETVPNRHDPGVTDTLFTLIYPGLAAHVHRPGGGGDLLSAVEATENRYLRFPGLGIGTPRDRVEEVLGPPDEMQNGAYVYRCRQCEVDESVRFDFADGRVSRVRFNYYVD